jgi:hypothetical protein
MQKRDPEHLDEIRKETPTLPEVPQPDLYDVTWA